MGIALSLAGLGEVEVENAVYPGSARTSDRGGAQSGAERGARLLGAAHRLLEVIGAMLLPEDSLPYERGIASAQARLGEEALKKAWEEGRAMAIEQAVAFALQGIAETPAGSQDEVEARSAGQAPPGPHGAELTGREVEVLGLVAQGLTNAQVAERLFVSPATVNTHLTSIYSKLGVANRSAAIHFATEHQLL
jgi:ATP/maltotriose-dependent transcriptional regulator MalT